MESIYFFSLLYLFDFFIYQMRSITPRSGLDDWGRLLRVGLDVERAVGLIIERASFEGQRLLEEREQDSLVQEDHRATRPMPRDPDDAVICANREILSLFDELDREAAVPYL